MTSRKKHSHINTKKLSEKGFLSDNACKEQKRDLEKYLEEKVRRDEIILKELVRRFWEQNPDFELTQDIVAQTLSYP